jgi:hypothetical protein
VEEETEIYPHAFFNPYMAPHPTSERRNKEPDSVDPCKLAAPTGMLSQGQAVNILSSVITRTERNPIIVKDFGKGERDGRRESEGFSEKV